MPAGAAARRACGDQSGISDRILSAGGFCARHVARRREGSQDGGAVPRLSPGPLYFCESSSGRKAIDYEPRVEQLCRRHPEMGPCQYERDQCRARGGRVYTARNEEVTVAVEAEYDRVVRRVRFQGDSGKK